jgi:hypothetical protein
MKRILLITIFSSFILTAFAGVPGYSDWLQDGSVRVDSTQNELRIYPNPAETGKVTLEMNTGEISEVRLINIAGKEVVYRKMDFGTAKYELPLDNVPSGIYFVRVKSIENRSIVKKLVVSSR